MKLSQRLPRPSLLWLSRWEVLNVRNKIAQLGLPPNDRLQVRPPDGQLGPVLLSGKLPINFMVGQAKYFLKTPKDRNPYWEYEDTRGEVIQIAFNDKLARTVALLVKAYARHFPFAETQLFLQNGGKFIA